MNLKIFQILSWVVIGGVVWLAEAGAQDVGDLLRDAAKNNPYVIEANDPLIEQLRERGVRCAADLKAYLEKAGLPQIVVLKTMKAMGGWDEETLKSLQKLAAESPEKEAHDLAFSIVLNNSQRDQATAYVLETLPRLNDAQLCAVMVWLSKQDPTWHRDSQQAQELARLTITRMKTVIESERPDRQIMACVAMSGDSFPFNQRHYLEQMTTVALAALANPSKLSDASIMTAFDLVKKNSSMVTEMVEKGLLAIVDTASAEVTKILLWQVFLYDFDKTDIGGRLIRAALKKWPNLTEYMKRLEQTTFSVSWGDDPVVSRDVQQTLYKLWGWQKKDK